MEERTGPTCHSPPLLEHVLPLDKLGLSVLINNQAPVLGREILSFSCRNYTLDYGPVQSYSYVPHAYTYLLTDGSLLLAIASGPLLGPDRKAKVPSKVVDWSVGLDLVATQWPVLSVGWSSSRMV